MKLRGLSPNQVKHLTEFLSHHQVIYITSRKYTDIVEIDNKWWKMKFGEKLFTDVLPEYTKFIC